MAISKIKPRHASEGRSIAAVLKDRIDYPQYQAKPVLGIYLQHHRHTCGGWPVLSAIWSEIKSHDWCFCYKF